MTSTRDLGRSFINCPGGDGDAEVSERYPERRVSTWSGLQGDEARRFVAAASASWVRHWVKG